MCRVWHAPWTRPVSRVVFRRRYMKYSVVQRLAQNNSAVSQTKLGYIQPRGASSNKYFLWNEPPNISKSYYAFNHGWLSKNTCSHFQTCAVHKFSSTQLSIFISLRFVWVILGSSVGRISGRISKGIILSFVARPKPNSIWVSVNFAMPNDTLLRPQLHSNWPHLPIAGQQAYLARTLETQTVQEAHAHSSTHIYCSNDIPI